MEIVENDDCIERIISSGSNGANKYIIKRVFIKPNKIVSYDISNSKKLIKVMHGYGSIIVNAVNKVLNADDNINIMPNDLYVINAGHKGIEIEELIIY